MKLTPVSCQNCGASLEVPDHAKFVTCQFCRSRLSVQHTGSAVFTELLGEIAEKTTVMAGDLKAIRLQNDIEKLDREWDLERATHMIRGKDGALSEPGAAGAFIGGVVAIGFGIFWMAMVSHASGAFALFGLVFIGYAIYSIFENVTKGQAYESARNTYQQQRRELEDKLRSGD